MNKKQGMRARRGALTTDRPVEVTRSIVGQAAKQREEEERARAEQMAAKEAAAKAEEAERKRKEEATAWELRKQEEQELEAARVETEYRLLAEAEAQARAIREQRRREVTDPRPQQVPARPLTATEQLSRARDFEALVRPISAPRPTAANMQAVDPVTRALHEGISERLRAGRWGQYRSTSHVSQDDHNSFSLALNTYRRPNTVLEMRYDPEVRVGNHSLSSAREQQRLFSDVGRALVDRAEQLPANITAIQTVEGRSELFIDNDVRTAERRFVYGSPIRHVIISGFGTPNALVTEVARAHVKDLQSVARVTINRMFPNSRITELYTIGVDGNERWVARINYDGDLKLLLLTADAQNIDVQHTAPTDEQAQAALGAMIGLLRQG